MQSALNRLDSFHLKVSNTIDALDPYLFEKRPTENEWSVAEVVHHLCLVEGRVQSELEKGLHRPPAKIGLLKKFLPMRIVALRLNRVRAPKAVEPLNPPGKEELLKTYHETRAQLKQFCTTHGRSALKKTSLRHPVFGEIDGVAAIDMVAYHELRHYKQILEILKKLGSAN
jgi:hypothetical protein